MKNICSVASLCVAFLLMSCTLSAATIYTTDLLGANERPNPINTPATGSTTVTLSDDELSLTVEVTWADLLAPAAAAHIHCCGGPDDVEPVAVPFTGFPSTVSGTFTGTFDLTDIGTYGPNYLALPQVNNDVTAARTVLIAALNAGQTYANIHDEPNPGGEIRGQLAVTAPGAIPEPSTVLLIGAGLGLVIAARLRQAS